MKNTRIKVLHVNCSNSGSIGKIIDSIREALCKRGDSSILCYEIGSAPRNEYEYKLTWKYEQGLYRRINYLIGYPYAIAPLPTMRLWRIICKEQPDIIHLHCPNANSLNIYKLLIKIRIKEMPIVLTHHCEMFYTGSCHYSYDCEEWVHGCKHCKHPEYVGPYRGNRVEKAWTKLLQTFQGNRITAVSVSKWVFKRSIQSPILAGAKNIIINNGLNVSKFMKNTQDVDQLRQQLGIEKKDHCVLFVTSQFSIDKDNIKGGYYFIQLAKRLKNIRFILVGASNVNDDLPKNIINVGRVYDQERLIGYYRMADLSIVCSKKETFSMVCAESLCAGTPIVGFKAGGPESISLPQYSEFCEYGDIDGLVGLVRKWITYKNIETSEQIQKQAMCQYDDNLMSKQYLDVYDSLLDRKHDGE